MVNPLFNAALKKTADTLMNFDKSEVLNTTDELVAKGNEFLDTVDKKYSHDPLTIEALLSKLSPSIDEHVIKHSIKNNLQPVGGEISLKSDKEGENVHLIWEFYYTDSAGNYVKTDSEKVLQKKVFTEDSFQAIKMNSPTFEIDPPKL